MITLDFPHRNDVEQIGHKLLSMIDFKGSKVEEVAKVLVSAALLNDSIENKLKMFGISDQTVSNYAEKEEVAERTRKSKAIIA
ncbi:DUF4322 domain-containing protein [Saccharolobus solfataricus]|uniref:First ORF in partial transposon ISC1160 n=2 Tax=Saccharolobus solfataricus TaxID=2287 RepID=Q97YN1_SACS2|nr:First ORF in partial transposon ISC1160 [Saccharolobus solfataricus P2]AYN75612.1 DUF4322 domain-containing protein [Saccharolobus solfataricus]AYN75774.1 DUF4322 domain-containing protein [Saccharolobus solfataricus]AYP18609.1 DUF4322 domain-containing protein [Saccharolobus solfataricus]AZF68932.1 DUF4322 domain-containing protein [Saccharolobus solfataricus]